MPNIDSDFGNFTAEDSAFWMTWLAPYLLVQVKQNASKGNHQGYFQNASYGKLVVGRVLSQPRMEVTSLISE